MPVKDYYTTLGIPPQASQEEIKKAYRRLALQYHPDKNPDDPYALAQFTEIKEAWEVLSNLGKRQRYHEERWLQRSEGRDFASGEALTPVSVLKRILQLEKDIQQHDHYRMNHHAMAEKAAEQLSNDIQEKVRQFKDGDIEQQVIYAGLRIGDMLAYRQSTILWRQLQVWAAPHTSLKTAVQQQMHRHQRRAFIERWQWAAVLLVAALVCVLIGVVTG